MYMAPTYNVSRLIFDDKLQRQIGVARFRTLSRQGAFWRRRHRSQHRRRKRVSGTSQYPSVRSRHSVRTLKNVRFAYDPTTETVVAGTVKLYHRNRNLLGNDSVPGILERSGQIRITQVWINNGWRIAGGNFKRRPGLRSRRRRVNVAARHPAEKTLQHEVTSGRIVNTARNQVRA